MEFDTRFNDLMENFKTLDSVVPLYSVQSRPPVPTGCFSELAGEVVKIGRNPVNSGIYPERHQQMEHLLGRIDEYYGTPGWKRQERIDTLGERKQRQRRKREATNEDLGGRFR